MRDEKNAEISPRVLTFLLPPPSLLPSKNSPSSIPETLNEYHGQEYS